jgi:hypothetical protein
MIRPDEKILEAIVKLESNTLFIEIVKWIEDSLHAQNTLNNHLRDQVDILKGLGRSLELEELLNKISNARNFIK